TGKEMSNTEKTLIDVYNKALVTRAKYVAMDGGGEVYGYEEKPKCGEYHWGGGGECIDFETVDVGSVDWRRTLLEMGSASSREVVRILEEVRTMERPRKENTPSFDLEAALAGAPVKLRGGGKAYIRFVEREYETDYPVVGVLVAGVPAIVTLWRECGRYIDSDTEGPCDIVGMWVDYKLINGHKVPDISFTPEEGAGYYFPELSYDRLVSSSEWRETSLDLNRLKRGLIYPATTEGEAAAIAHAKAMLGETSE